MARRVSVPAADDLFRRTGERGPVRAVPDQAETAAQETPGGSAARRGPSGRVRHEEKMTVYVTAAELMEIEQARLMLRGGHGLAVDRGRLVREALHLVLADLEANGDQSALVRRLHEA